MTNTLDKSENKTTTIKTPNLVVSVSKIEKGSDDVSFPKRGEKIENVKSSITIPAKSLKGMSSFSTVVYKNLSGILTTSNKGEGQKQKKKINSEVVSLTMANWERNKDFSVTLNIGHFQEELSSPACNFWNTSLNGWDTLGCSLKATDSISTTCECNHLTNFAILMSPFESNNVDTKAIDVISLVGCSVSLLGLLITVGMHIYLWRYMKSDRAKILMNLSVALIISYAIFIGGVDRTENKDVCTAMAVLLQYIYLVVFFLMLTEGVEIAFMVLYVFSTRSRIRWMLPLAWLLPAVIVGISLGATQLEGYGNEQFCWLSVEGGLIWAFVAPALLIILVNFVLLILIVRATFNAQSLAQKSKQEKSKAGVRCLCVLLPLMGCTWVLGIFYVNENMAWVQYVFAVFNSLQGFVIFLFHCATNQQVRTSFQKKSKRKHSESFLSTKSSGKAISLPRISLTDVSDVSYSYDQPFKFEHQL
ncbi:adhesion G protein-coupled receptor L3-like [Mya arenaria]|uniref:adhesion G protein-coupled receptor L3-like n=1 Tax=Mya arenaria TaxID=6604 RepID=UPI0022DEC61A|nr:adhesion G protein-coupled receptor L3-like [Mya arenaria]